MGAGVRPHRGEKRGDSTRGWVTFGSWGGKMGDRKDVKTVDNERIGSFIRELRKEKELTQRDLADALHITDRAVSKWERGLNAPDIALLEPLSELLGVSVGELIRGQRDREEEPQMDETKSLLDYSKGEISRKVRGERKKYLSLLAGCLTLLFLVGGALLWRSGVFFLLDRKASPDGQSVVRVYSKNWDFWPLRFTLEDAVQVILEDGDAKSYITYRDSEYEGLWWAPDGRKYVLSFRERDGKRRVVLNWLDTHNEWNLNPILNMGGEDTEYQFLQWGKDGESMLFYYGTETASNQKKEGYFWYNCRTGKVSGELELPTVWEWGEK